MDTGNRVVIVSTVGTSLLTNWPIEQGCSAVLRNTANLEEKELTAEQKAVIDTRCAEVEQRLAENRPPEEWKKASAEINGILSYLPRMGKHLPGPGDQHILVGTKTYQGQMTARMVEEFLRRFGCTVIQMPTAELSTKNREEFLNGIARVADWCHQNLPEYRNQGYRVVFNLTGGFKGVQGCLTALGMYYADEVVYIFEGSELIVIPRLPIRLEALEEARRNAVAFGLLEGDRTLLTEALDAAGVVFDPNSAMFEVVRQDDQQMVGISVWGKLVWNEHRKEVLSEKLLDWPYLTYSERFRGDFERYSDPNLRTELQEKLALVSCRLIESGGNFGQLRGLSRLDYDKLDRHPGYDHFRVTLNYRVSCKPAHGKLLLCRFGPHDEVNNNPEC